MKYHPYPRMSLFPLLNPKERKPVKGLFGTKMRYDSLALLEDMTSPKMAFKDYNDWYHDYRNDIDYSVLTNKIFGNNTSIRGRYNLEFLKYLEQHKLTLIPMYLAREGLNAQLANRPYDEETAYIYPSYIIWRNDYSAYICDGDPSNIEISKDELKQTTGHPRYDSGKVSSNRFRIYPEWRD